MTEDSLQNPLRSRLDVQRMALTLCRPVIKRHSPAGARVQLGRTAAHYSDDVAALEGFSRTLWGLVPLICGGAEIDSATHLRGLAAGADPMHPEYWGRPVDKDQRLVEMTPIGLALAMARSTLWDPLSGEAQRNLARWLSCINSCTLADSNWLFFQVIVNEGLRSVRSEHFDRARQEAALDRIESFYIGDGWYSDGPTARRDYYVAWAFHFYGLIYATLAGDHDPDRAAVFRRRAQRFAEDYVHLFAANGSAVPFGRSMTYRFAQGSFWGALAFADVEAMPWGVVKGIVLRHLRWWNDQPIYDDNGLLTIGYAYPNLVMAESYNSPASPYWALKSFLPLALPESHPFWTADEQPIPSSSAPQVHVLPHAGMATWREPNAGHVVALSGGQHDLKRTHGAAKYAKFAYSTAFGFSVPAGTYGLSQGAFDNVLALSEDGQHWRSRERVDEASTSRDVVYSRWSPWPDVSVDTWLMARPPWHIRMHRIVTSRGLVSAEGGFAVDLACVDHASADGRITVCDGAAVAEYPAARSAIFDIGGTRGGEIVNAHPNTNLLYPRTAIPMLRADHPEGEHLLICAVIADLQPSSLAHKWPAPPTITELTAQLTAWRASARRF